jgi:hypothetical protein
MPHFKCVGCRTRLYSAASPADLGDDLCPGCGALLEPVGELTEIVGFQSIRLRRHQRIADRLDGLFARREATLSRAPLEAVAEAIALPTPRENP